MASHIDRRGFYSRWSSRRFPLGSKNGCDTGRWGSFGTHDEALCPRGETPSKQRTFLLISYAVVVIYYHHCQRADDGLDNANVLLLVSHGR